MWNPWHATYHKKGSIKMAGALKLRYMSWQQFFSVRFTSFVNLAQLVAGVDSPLPSPAPRVQDAWIRVGIRSTSITRSVEPTTTMSSPSFNPAIGHSIRSDLSSHVENTKRQLRMPAHCYINALGSSPHDEYPKETEISEDRILDLNTMKELWLSSMSLRCSNSPRVHSFGIS